MSFFGVFLRESARTAAKSRTNLSTNSGKATKRAGPIFGTKFRTRANSYGNGYTPNKLPLVTQGGHGGGLRGLTIQKSEEAVRLAPTLVLVCGLIWEWT